MTTQVVPHTETKIKLNACRCIFRNIRVKTVCELSYRHKGNQVCCVHTTEYKNILSLVLLIYRGTILFPPTPKNLPWTSHPVCQLLLECIRKGKQGRAILAFRCCMHCLLLLHFALLRMTCTVDHSFIFLCPPCICTRVHAVYNPLVILLTPKC